MSFNTISVMDTILFFGLIPTELSRYTRKKPDCSRHKTLPVSCLAYSSTLKATSSSRMLAGLNGIISMKQNPPGKGNDHKTVFPPPHNFFVWGETGSIWYVGHYLAYFTDPDDRG
jgi:hypothetical protein